MRGGLDFIWQQYLRRAFGKPPSKLVCGVFQRSISFCIRSRLPKNVDTVSVLLCFEIAKGKGYCWVAVHSCRSRVFGSLVKRCSLPSVGPSNCSHPGPILFDYRTACVSSATRGQLFSRRRAGWLIKPSVREGYRAIYWSTLMLGDIKNVSLLNSPYRPRVKFKSSPRNYWFFSSLIFLWFHNKFECVTCCISCLTRIY